MWEKEKTDFIGPSVEAVLGEGWERSSEQDPDEMLHDAVDEVAEQARKTIGELDGKGYTV